MLLALKKPPTNSINTINEDDQLAEHFKPKLIHLVLFVMYIQWLTSNKVICVIPIYILLSTQNMLRYLKKRSMVMLTGKHSAL